MKFGAREKERKPPERFSGAPDLAPSSEALPGEVKALGSVRLQALPAEQPLRHRKRASNSRFPASLFWNFALSNLRPCLWLSSLYYTAMDLLRSCNFVRGICSSANPQVIHARRV